ncbi:MAG TPA: PAS domain S-box protein, partial [Alkalispirochaeta sp.]|nr:PAS domain S-box protein [Alkalispirochaeta sp.]
MSDLERKHILLVEDEAIIAMTEKMQLEKYGYSVRTVTTGEKAVSAIQESPDIDLILMDINLGKGIDGTQAAAFILEDRDIPIVFLSSHTEPDVVEKTEKITSYGYVVKNSSATVLDASIKMAFKLFEAKVEAQKKEESLRQSEEKYRLQFMHMNSYNSMYDVVTDAEGRPCDFRFLMVNQAYEQYVGKEACELIGKTLLEVFPHTEQYWIDKMIEVVTTGEPSTYENYSSELDTYIEINLFTPQQGRVVMTSTNVTERKRIERELNESILRHRELESRIPVGVYILWIRANGTKEFEYVSDRWCELHGVGRERVIADSSTVDNLVYPDDRARFFEQNRVAAEERKPFRWEGRFLNGDGETRWFRIESTPFLHEDGDTRWFGVIQDITERKQAEENYLSLFNYSNDAIFVHELGDNKLPSKNIDVNEQAVRLLGYTKDELLNLSAKDVVPEEHASDMLRHAHELMEKKHLTFESENIRSDGVVIPVEVSAYLHTEGNKKLVISSVRDITERKQVEKELTDQKQHLETILETTADGFWVVAPDKRITRVNAAYCRMSGYSNEELTNMEINCIEAIEHPEDTDARMKRIQETGSEVFETKHRRKDGSLMDIEVSASSLEWDNGVWLVCFCRDITERKQAENAITALITEKETL